MYTIKLTDGTLLENLELNGNNYIAEGVISDEVFENNLKNVEISDGENVEIIQDGVLHGNYVHDGRSWIVLGEKSEEQKREEQLTALLRNTEALSEAMDYILFNA